MSTAYDDIKTRLQGSMVALVTPMHPDGEVDYKRLAELIDWQIEQGTHCLGAVGTTGESATLSMQEHSEVIRYFIKHVNGRVPVLAGTGSNSTAEAIALTKEAADAGADCVLLVTPYYNKPPQEGLYQHFKAIADAVAIPQMLYNVPGRTVADISQETMERLADIDNIIAVKDATGSVERGEKLVRALGDRMSVLSGDDGTALDLMRVGGKGNISVTTNIAPKVMSETFSAALRGDFAAAKAAHDTIEHLHRDLFLEANPIPVKYALHRMGLIEKGIRLPLVWLDSAHHETVDNALIKANLL